MNEPLRSARLKKVRILVCGGRDYSSYALFCFGMMEARKYIARAKIDVIIHGKCPSGADRMADIWARDEGIKVLAYPAAWNIHGRAAGPIRNRHMLDDGKPDYVFAFKGGNGTRDMVTKAMAAGVPILFPDNLLQAERSEGGSPSPAPTTQEGG